MRCLFLTANRLALCGVVLACVGSTGCKSGWKVPGASYLSFNKKVSEETLAGSGPTMTAPVSPSTTQQPNLLAGGAKTAKPAAPTGSTLGNASANPALANSAPSPYMTASATMPGQPSGVAGGVGAAAAANGYATGPYSTYAQQQAGNTFAAAGAAYNNTASSAYNAAANGYNTAASGAYNAAASGYNAAATGAYNAAASGYNAATTAYNNAAAPTAAAYGQVMQAASPQPGSFAAPSSASPATASLASSPATPSWGTAAAKPAAPAGYPSAPPAAGGYAVMPNATTPVSQGSMTAYNPVGGQSGYAAAPAGTPATPVSFGGAAPVQATAASYRPGSTQRATGYDFSGSAASPVTGGVPTSTASGMSNPGYQLPPSGSLQR